MQLKVSFKVFTEKITAIAAYAPLMIHMRSRWCHLHRRIFGKSRGMRDNDPLDDLPRKNTI